MIKPFLVLLRATSQSHSAIANRLWHNDALIRPRTRDHIFTYVSKARLKGAARFYVRWLGLQDGRKPARFPSHFSPRARRRSKPLPALLRFDPREPDHLAPLVGFVGDQLAEISRSESFPEVFSSHLTSQGHLIGGLLLWEVLILYCHFAGGDRIAAAHRGTVQCVNYVLRA